MNLKIYIAIAAAITIFQVGFAQKNLRLNQTTNNKDFSRNQFFNFNAKVKTDSVVWEYEIPNDYSADKIVACGNTLFFMEFKEGSHTRYLSALNAENGKLLWHKPNYWGLLISDCKTNIVYSFYENQIKALEGKTGNLIWSYTIKTKYISDYILHKNQLIVGDSNSIVILNKTTGVELERIPLPFYCPIGFSVLGNQLYSHAVSSSNYGWNVKLDLIFKMDLNHPRVFDTYQMQSAMSSGLSKIILTKNYAIFNDSSWQKLLVFDKQKFDLITKLNFEYPNFDYVVENDRIYFTRVFPGELKAEVIEYSLLSKKERLLWHGSTEHGAITSLFVTNNYVFFSAGWYMYKLDKTLGDIIWQKRGYPDNLECPIVNKNNLIINSGYKIIRYD